MANRRWVAAGMAVAVLAGVAAAEPADSNSVITADGLVFDYGRMVGVFEGNCVVADPQVRMACDKLTVIFEGTNDVKSVTATGNVRVFQGDKSATCDQAVYIARSGEIELNGNAHLFRAKDTISGKKITFWLNEERVVCTPARLTIYPTGDRKGGDAGLPALLPTGAGRPKRSP